MRHFESPNVPFTIIQTRFKTAPEVVVYDNACHLMSYALNRDPFFWKETRFFVDRFHWGNHTSCSASFNLRLIHEFARLNSQVTEQTNSSLGKLRTQLAYMTMENFTVHVKLFLYIKNQEKMKINDFD